MRQFLLTLAAAGCLAAANPVQAGYVFDNSSRGNAESSRAAGSSPLAAITVSSSQSLNQIAVSFDPDSDGHLKFLIFDLDTSALLFSTAELAFTDSGMAFYESDPFAAFTLNPGINYAIGAVADVGGGWTFNMGSSGNPYTQGAFTASDDRNGNVLGYASPTLSGSAFAMIVVKLGVAEEGTVPEPTSLALVLAGLAAAGAARKRLRA